MAELISESIMPHASTADTVRMALGEPGLPAGFDWRGEPHDISELLSTWKHSSREGSHAAGDLYLRRHYYRLRMRDGAVWTVYLVRQAPKSGSAKKRWFLYSVER